MPTPNSKPKLDARHLLPSHRRILELPESVSDDEGNLYTARVFASALAAGSWAGWLQFRLESTGRPTVSTGSETVQGSPGAVTQWALSLAPEYPHDALERALRRSGRPTKLRPRLVGPHVVVTDESGTHFEARVFVQADGHLWIAWIEFEPVGDLGPVLVTQHETSQPSLGAAISWVTGLELGSFQRALERARLWSCPGTEAREARDVVQPRRRWPHDHR